MAAACYCCLLLLRLKFKAWEVTLVYKNCLNFIYTNTKHFDPAIVPYPVVFETENEYGGVKLLSYFPGL